jgi:modification methylase
MGRGVIMPKGTHTSSFGTMGRINHDSNTFYKSKLYSGMSKVDKPISNVENEFPKERINTIMQKSSEEMTDIPDNSLHLMITSPPYNVTKDYDDDLSLEEYLTLLRNVFVETYRVLVPGGRACINIANVGRKPYIPLSDNISHIMMEIGYLMRGEVIWNKGASAGVSMAWGSWQSASNPVLRDVHEYILIFSKGDYKRQKAEKEDTIQKEQFMEWTKSVWNMNPESAKRVKHPAPFPEELPFRLIQLYSFKNDIILDPFMGSGTTAIAALKSNRNYVGYDISKEYVQITRERIAEFQKQGEFSFQ